MGIKAERRVGLLTCDQEVSVSAIACSLRAPYVAIVNMHERFSLLQGELVQFSLRPDLCPDFGRNRQERQQE